MILIAYKDNCVGIGYTDTLLLLWMLYSFFPVIPLSHQNLCRFSFRGNKHDQLDTLTQCAEWSEFAFQHFLESDLRSKKLELFKI